MSTIYNKKAQRSITTIKEVSDMEYAIWVLKSKINDLNTVYSFNQEETEEKLDKIKELQRAIEKLKEHNNE